MFERNYSFFHHCLSSCRCVMFQKQYFEYTKMGGHKQPLGGARPPGPSIATALDFNDSNSRVWTKKQRSSSREFPRILGWRPKKKVFVSKTARISTNSRAKTDKKKKKKRHHLKKWANFYEFWGESTKKGSLLQNLPIKQFLLTNSGVITSVLGVSGLELHSSGTEPKITFHGAQSSFGRRRHNSRLGGVQAVIWGARLRNAPRGARPAYCQIDVSSSYINENYS